MSCAPFLPFLPFCFVCFTNKKKIAPRCYIHLKWQLYTYLANTEPALLSKSMAMAMTKRQKYRWFNIVKSGSFALLQCFGFTLLLWNYMRRRQSGIGAVSMPIRWVSRFLGVGEVHPLDWHGGPQELCGLMAAGD